MNGALEALARWQTHGDLYPKSGRSSHSLNHPRFSTQRTRVFYAIPIAAFATHRAVQSVRRASSRPKGYIMDQWLGCSVNLLTGRQIVKLDQHLTWQLKQGRPEQRVDSYVSDLNTGQDYEAFCRSVESLSL
jgi:hypothetical protein